MEQNIKRKITVEIAGVNLTLVTDENSSFVDSVVAQVNDRMESILAGSLRTGTCTMDAALLCAIDSTGERLKAETKVRNLEAKLSLYEVNMRNLKEELDKLRAPADEEKEEGIIMLSLSEDGFRAYQEQRFHSISASLFEAKISRELAIIAIVISFVSLVIAIIVAV